ncbi:hypothetical protein P5704_027870 (plasmid) [Pseudomonas sp. FeN3W]|nr:hypothetical protein P5704_027870 [Pseudomonas sp. FeN3W]
MIDYSLLDRISDDLTHIRALPDTLIFDSRDRGNYGAYEWDGTVAMLKKNDPTGLAMGMLLHEMIEATINGSRINLHQVLREEGFVEKVSSILALKSSLDEAIKDPMLRFQERITARLSKISEAYGEPSIREVACCLRDAIYCMSSGFKINWISKDPVIDALPLHLSDTIVIAETIAEFVDMLKHGLPMGAYIARIGHSQTAIGIKRPGCTLFYSTLSVNVRTGDMEQKRANNAHMRERLDLDGMVERYPEWNRVSYYGDSSKVADENFTQVDQLPRDVVIWLAMVVELAQQQINEQATLVPLLVESLHSATLAETEIKNLPVLARPRWTLSLPTLESMLAQLNFSEWELKVARSALDGMAVEDFLPVSTQPMGCMINDKKIIEWPELRFSSETEEFAKKAIRLRSLNPNIVGTQDEMQEVVRSIIGYNIGTWVIETSNLLFDNLWKNFKPEFERCVRENMCDALAHSCVKWSKNAEAYAYDAVNLYRQSAKHKTYNPRCVFDGKSQVDVVAIVKPGNSQDLAEIMGISVSDLPDLLNGWSRNQGWASSDRNQAPFDIGSSWMFSDEGRNRHGRALSHYPFTAYVRCNERNLASRGYTVEIKRR